MAALYASSDLKQRNDGDVATHAKQRSVIGKESLKAEDAARDRHALLVGARRPVQGAAPRQRDSGRVISIPWTRHGCSATAAAKP